MVMVMKVTMMMMGRMIMVRRLIVKMRHNEMKQQTN